MTTVCPAGGTGAGVRDSSAGGAEAGGRLVVLGAGWARGAAVGVPEVAVDPQSGEPSVTVHERTTVTLTDSSALCWAAAPPATPNAATATRAGSDGRRRA